MNCKQGDLAFIIESAIPENLMAIVRVLELVPDATGLLQSPDGRQWVGVGEPTWMVRSEGRPLLTATDDGIVGWGHQERPFLDRCLKPIREPDEDETEREPIAEEQT